MMKNMRSDTPMGSPTLFWGLTLSVFTICICSTCGESKYIYIYIYKTRIFLKYMCGLDDAFV